MELHEDNFPVLLTLTGKAAPQWKTIAAHLGFSPSDIRLIECKPLLIPEGASGYYQEMIAQWLEWAPPNHPLPTVETLASALRKAGKERLALELEKKMKPEKGEQEATLEEEKVIELVCGDYKFSSKTRAPPTATPTAPLALPPPVEEGQPDTQEDFDIVSALLGAGVPHIPDQIFSHLDGRCLTTAEAVSTLWRAVVGESPVWKNLVKQTVKSNRVWRDLFERRGWNKYLHVPLSQQTSSQFYRHLHQSTSRDIHSLETNWRRGHYTLTKIKIVTTVRCLQCNEEYSIPQSKREAREKNWRWSKRGHYNLTEIKIGSIVNYTVRCLQYDDDKIVTGHGDFTIKILDRSTLQVSKVLKGHKDRVRCLQYNEEMLISGSFDHTVKVWDIQTGQMVNELLHHNGNVKSLKFTTNTLVTGSSDKTVAVFNIKSPTDITLRTVLKGHQSDVWAVDLSETIVVSGSFDRTIKVWDSMSGGLVRTLHGHSGGVMSLQLRGSHLISGSCDKTIRIWNIDSGDCIRVLRGHNSRVPCVAVDDNRIISGSVDCTVKVWDLAAALDPGSSSNALITTLKHTAGVWAVSFDAFQLISGSSDGSVLIYDFLQLDPVTSS